LGRAEEVRATIAKIASNAGAIEFVAADLNTNAGWADAVTGAADYVLVLGRSKQESAVREIRTLRATPGR
jgi:hypothetical protein